MKVDLRELGINGIGDLYRSLDRFDAVRRRMSPAQMCFVFGVIAGGAYSHKAAIEVMQALDSFIRLHPHPTESVIKRYLDEQGILVNTAGSWPRGKAILSENEPMYEEPDDDA
jgi:hypothetical protein